MRRGLLALLTPTVIAKAMTMRRAMTSVVAGGVLGLAIAGSLGAAAAQGGHAQGRAAVFTHAATPGRVDEATVYDGSGAVVGHRSAAEVDQVDHGGGDSVLPIGSGSTSVHGFRVYDDQEHLVGYEVGALGFVPLATADDPAAVDLLLRDAAAQEADAYRRFHPEFVERFGGT